MKKTEKEIVAAPARRLPTSAEQSTFDEVLAFIEQSRVQASQAVNTVLIDLYWKVGEYVWHKIKNEGCRKGTVLALSTFVQNKHLGILGFSAQNIWRMRQFFDACRDQPKLSTLLRELPWSLNVMNQQNLDSVRLNLIRDVARRELRQRLASPPAHGITKGLQP